MGAGNVCTPARAGFAGDAYTLANETADGTTWRPGAPVVLRHAASRQADRHYGQSRNIKYLTFCM